MTISSTITFSSLFQLPSSHIFSDSDLPIFLFYDPLWLHWVHLHKPGYSPHLKIHNTFQSHLQNPSCHIMENTHRLKELRQGHLQRAITQSMTVEQLDNTGRHFGLWQIPFLFSVQFSHSVLSNSLGSHGLQHSRPPCPAPTRSACSNSCPSSQWCHPTISSSVICREPAWEFPPITRSCGRALMGKASQGSRVPLDLPEHLPQNQNLSVLLFYDFHQLLWH